MANCEKKIIKNVMDGKTLSTVANNDKCVGIDTR